MPVLQRRRECEPALECGESGKRLEGDAELNYELSYCVPLGIPHSFFLGGEFKWTQDDRDKAILWTSRERQRCQCGTFPDEWLEDGRPVDDPPWEMRSRRCIACSDLEEAREALGKEDPPVKGIYLYYRRTGD